MCAKNECDSRNRTRTKKTNNYAHIHVFTKCVTSLSGFMCFVLILVFTLSLVSDVSPFNRKVLYVNLIPNTSYFLLDVVVRLCPVIVNSNCIPNSCMFHIAKTGPSRCCLHISRRVKLDSGFNVMAVHEVRYMKFPDMDQNSLIASPASGNES